MDPRIKSLETTTLSGRGCQLRTVGTAAGLAEARGLRRMGRRILDGLAVTLSVFRPVLSRGGKGRPALQWHRSRMPDVIDARQAPEWNQYILMARRQSRYMERQRIGSAWLQVLASGKSA